METAQFRSDARKLAVGLICIVNKFAIGWRRNALVRADFFVKKGHQ